MLNVLIYIKHPKFVYKKYRKEKETMKTRIISMILVVVMLTLTLVGCGYDFTKKDMSENAEFAEGYSLEALKAELKNLTVEDADFGNVGETTKRAKKVRDAIYALLLKEVETTTSTSNVPKDQLKEGDFDVNDWFFYSYYATYVKTTTTDDGETTETIVIYPSKMSTSSVSVQLGYSDQKLSGADVAIRDAFLAAMANEGKLNFADWAYKTNSDKTVNIYDYVNKDTDKQVYVYVNYSVTENNTTKDYKNVKMLLDLNDGATLGFLANALLATKDVVDDKGTADDTSDDEVTGVTGKYTLNTEIAEIIDNKGTTAEKPADLAEGADDAAKEAYNTALEAYNKSLEDDVKYSKITVSYAVESDITKYISATYKTEKEITGVDVEQGSNITLPKDTEITYYVYPVYFASVPEATAEVIIKDLIETLSKDSLDCLENAETEIDAFKNALTALNTAKDNLEKDENTYEEKVSTFTKALESAVKTLKEKEGADATAIDTYAGYINGDDVKNSLDPVAEITTILEAKIAEADETVKAAIAAFKTAIVEDSVIVDASNAVKTAKTKVDTDKKTLDGDPEGADDKAKDGAQKTYDKALEALFAKVGDDANDETIDDAVKGEEKIVADYEKDTYDALAEEYETALKINIGKAIWALMKKSVKVTNTPEKAVKEIYTRMYEEKEYAYYTGTHEDSKESNYKHYAQNGGFKQYLIENTIGAGKGDFDDAKDYLMEEAKKYVEEIVILYFVADQLGYKLDKKQVKEYKKTTEYETYVESYGEINMLASYQAEVLYDYLLEVETEEKDGVKEPKLDEATGARKYLNITVGDYTEKTEDSDSTN